MSRSNVSIWEYRWANAKNRSCLLYTSYLYYSSPVFPFHQNVMFTFFIALLLMLGLEKVRSKGTGMYILAAVLSLPVGYFLGTIGMVDYYGSGVVTVLIFYLCRQIPHGWRCV